MESGGEGDEQVLALGVEAEDNVLAGDEELLDDGTQWGNLDFWGDLCHFICIDIEIWCFGVYEVAELMTMISQGSSEMSTRKSAEERETEREQSTKLKRAGFNQGIYSCF